MNKGSGLNGKRAQKKFAADKFNRKMHMQTPNAKDFSICITLVPL